MTDNGHRGIEENELEFVALHRSAIWKLPHARLLVSSDRSVPTWNFAGALDLTDGTEEKIALCEAAFDAWGIRPCFKVTPFTLPAALPQLLTKRGYAVGTTLTHMIDGSPGTDSSAADVQVRTCRTRQEIRTFSEVQSFGFGATDAWTAWVDVINQVNVADGSQRFYLAEIDGRPVGVTLLLVTNRIAGLYAVATLPEARRRGVAASLIAQARRDALALGATTLCLNTREGGPAEQVFAALGFRPVFASRFFVR